MTSPEPEVEAPAEAVEAEASSDEVAEIDAVSDDAATEETAADEAVAEDETASDDAVADEAVADDAAEDDSDVEVDIASDVPAVFSDRPVQTVGRRKEAVVRVRLMPGTGNFTLNGKSIETYFPNKLHQQLIREPLVLLEKTERFDIFANLHGGGISGQAGALRLAIARALIEVDPEDRPPLKKAGFLTRDPRVIERKKYGLKKARKAPQYSKR
ncbi:30S ribosomal protein S9 [Pseudonocardia saturnea]